MQLNTASTDQIGRKAWLQRTQGCLSFKDRLQLIGASLLPTMQQLGRMHLASHRKTHAGSAVHLTVDTLQLPDSYDTRQALQEVQDCASEDILNHSIRTWFYAAAFARLAHLPIDQELLAAGCLLHDLGATSTYHQHHPQCQCFAGQGAYAAADWAKQQGWPELKQDLLFDMICLHMNAYVPVRDGAEAHLLQQATACDVIGLRMQELPLAYRQDVLVAYPRLNFNEAFLAFTRHEAEIRPKSRAALVLDMGFAFYLKTNPYQH